VSQQLIYEHPLNERTRTFLRLEHLLAKAEHFAARDNVWDTRSAIEAILDIVAITSRTEVKGELLKELDRHTATLNRIRRQPDIHAETLDRILDDIMGVAAELRAIAGNLGQRARDDDLLKAVAQRTTIPGGTCSFDLPVYHRWLAQPAAARRQWLGEWLGELAPAREAIGLVLSLTRTSAAPRPVTAPLGFFQEALDSEAPAQMIRVGLNGDGRLYPEISGHRNRFSIRFMEGSEGERPSQSRDDVNFNLTCCVF